MNSYERIRRALIVILVIMVIFSFVAIITLHIKLEDNVQAVNILIEHMNR